jgi:hypothetical protein
MVVYVNVGLCVKDGGVAEGCGWMSSMFLIDIEDWSGRGSSGVH